MYFMVVGDLFQEKVQPVNVDVQLPTLELLCEDKVLEAYLKHTVVSE